MFAPMYLGCQYLMNCRACPWTPILSQNSATVQFGVISRSIFLERQTVRNLTNCLNLQFRARNRMTRSVCRLFRSPRPTAPWDSCPGQSTVAADHIGRTTLTESQFDQTTLPEKTLTDSPGCIRRHRTLQRFKNGR